jgi:peptidoglycan/xylan/chitin deacetylase (PgdA/CDA1 family)
LKLALRIDVDTLRATRDGVPRLVTLLREREADATFFFSVGPDRSGGLGRPDLGRRCADAMRTARDAGFEIGLHAWDATLWRRQVAQADAEWTARQLALAMARFEEVFGERAAAHSAPGWKMNKHAWRATQALGFEYGADTCGTHPFVPVLRAELVACPQVPTTLPSMDDWIGREGVTEADVVERLLKLTADGGDHVYTLRAGSEGLARAAAFERLLDGWKKQGFELVRLRTLLAVTTNAKLPLHAVLDGPVPDRRGIVALQGPEFLASGQPVAA